MGNKVFDSPRRRTTRWVEKVGFACLATMLGVVSLSITILVVGVAFAVWRELLK